MVATIASLAFGFPQNGELKPTGDLGNEVNKLWPVQKCCHITGNCLIEINNYGYVVLIRIVHRQQMYNQMEARSNSLSELSRHVL